VADPKRRASAANSAHLDFGKEFSSTAVVHVALSRIMITTTTDKLRLCLMRRRGDQSALSAWVSPAGIFLTLVVTLVAADFHDAGLKKSTWSTMFIMATGAVGLWLGCSLWNAVKFIQANWRTRFTDPAEMVINDLIADSRQLNSNMGVPGISGVEMIHPAHGAESAGERTAPQP
jgi:hypothetical protein